MYRFHANFNKNNKVLFHLGQLPDVGNKVSKIVLNNLWIDKGIRLKGLDQRVFVYISQLFERYDFKLNIDIRIHYTSER